MTSQLEAFLFFFTSSFMETIVYVVQNFEVQIHFHGVGWLCKTISPSTDSQVNIDVMCSIYTITFVQFS
jgi:hypothetical protein